MDREKYYSQLTRARQESKERDKERYKELSKQRLLNILEKKILTATIGAISKFEEGFGELWGHNSMRLTEDQKAEREIWEQTRQRILDLGNAQIRAVRQEFEQYVMQWEKYQTEFVSVQEYEDLTKEKE